MNVVRQVGSPDPQQRNSPIHGLTEEGMAVDSAVRRAGETGCYFNGETFPAGAEVQSDDALLRCEGGRWAVAESPAGQPS